MLIGGTNLVVSDRGFPGIVLRFVAKAIARDGCAVEVDAGDHGVWLATSAHNPDRLDEARLVRGLCHQFGWPANPEPRVLA